MRLTLANIVGAVVEAGNDVGILRALAAVVVTVAHGELGVLGTQAVLDDVGGLADGGGLCRGDSEHGGEGKESGLHLDGLVWEVLLKLGLAKDKDGTRRTRRKRRLNDFTRWKGERK